MSLLSVYQAHAAVCSKMAANARDVEIKDRWVELADQWRQKARACEGFPTEPPPLQPLPQPEIADAPPGLPRVLTITSTDVQLMRQPPASWEVAKAGKDHATNGDHDWKRLLADIRAK